METTPLNPWFSMWRHPRRTIRQIVETDPERLVLLLAALGGIVQGLASASNKSQGDRVSLTVILLANLVLGPVMGIVGLWLGGALLRWTGRWIGGQADTRRVRTALAWSNVPMIWSLLLWIPAILLFGQELFTDATPAIDANSLLAVLYVGFSIGTAVIGVWSFVVCLHALGEVQGFSAWTALLNMLLAFLVILVPLLAIVGIAVWLGP